MTRAVWAAAGSQRPGRALRRQHQHDAERGPPLMIASAYRSAAAP
jgi:hypothetical protein